MEIVLTGRNFSAKEASDWGLVSRIVGDKHDETVAEAIKVAEKISSKGRISVQAAKEAVGAGKQYKNHRQGHADSFRSVRVTIDGWSDLREAAIPYAICDRKYNLGFRNTWWLS